METVAQKYDLTKHPFPKVDVVDLAFPTFNTDPALKAEAYRLKFDYDNNPYQRLTATLFYKGGKVKFRDDVDKDFRSRVWLYVRGFMGSFAPKHEDKFTIFY
jgi:hypothetical protein